MQDTSALEPFDVRSLEAEVSSLVTERGAGPYAPSIPRRNVRFDRRLPEPRLENDTEMAEPAGPTDAPQTASDPVNHPTHYNQHPSGVECIVITREMNYNLGSVMAYIWRADHKGSTIEDLKKARWHLSDEIARLEKLANG